jgi:hypothetical protein
MGMNGVDNVRGAEAAAKREGHFSNQFGYLWSHEVGADQSAGGCVFQQLEPAAMFA